MLIPGRLILLFVLATLASGCTVVGPDFVAPTTAASAHWSDRHGGADALAAPLASSAAPPTDRWAVFGDPELIRLQALALQANADVKSAVLRLLQARVTQTTVSAQRGVQVAAQGDVSRQRQSEFGSASRLVNAIGGASTPQLLNMLSSPFTLYQAGFDASWEPDLWGRVLRSEEAAQAGTDEQQAALRQVQLGVAAELARAYFALRAAQQQQRLTQDELASAQEIEGLLQAQFRNGLADESALIRQRSQVAAVHALLPALLAQEAQAINQITLLCGTEPGSLNDALAAARMTHTAAALPDLRLGLPSELAHRRPDVAAAEARLHAATANIGVAVADLYPRITLGADFGLESVGSARFGDWGSRQWTVGPSLNLPVWDQGRRRSTITLRKLQQQEAAVAYQQVVLKAWHEVDDAISTYVAETQRETRFTERARNAQEEAALARARRADGLTSYLPVLNAAVAVIDAQRDLTDSNARVRTALAALYKALGDDGAPGVSAP
ncbi:MAG: efflux transporter outer membrane subunit [Rhodoferax sp.]|nr:efflux transporter outer membrane subunit [Rhodoferax sp.]